MKSFADQWAEFDARRMSAGVTDRELSRISGVDYPRISRFRHGAREPTMGSWVRLNDALDAIIAERITTLRRLA